jgi:predicted dehydrogenase
LAREPVSASLSRFRRTISILTRFEQGPQAQSLLSFDSPLFRHGIVEISGTEATIVLPDPNTFSGRIALVRPLKELARPVSQTWEEIPERGTVVGRGLGVLDLARAVRENRPHLATGELAYHVLDTLIAIEESASQGVFVSVESTAETPGTLPEDFDPFARKV